MATELPKIDDHRIVVVMGREMYIHESMFEERYTKDNYYDPAIMNGAEANKDNTSWWYFEDGQLKYREVKPDHTWIRRPLPAWAEMEKN